MATSSNFPRNGDTSPSSESSPRVPRLFNFDLPALRKTGQALPEQAASAPLNRVLDIASGDGEWAIRMALANPQTQIIGIEIDAQAVARANAQAKARAVNNVSFIAMNPFHRLDFPDCSFDLVNARFIAGLIPAASWPGMLQEFFRVTRSGGIVRLTETDLPITSNPAFAKLGGMISQAFFVTERSFSPHGRLPSITPALKHLLQDVGCQNTQQAVCVTNFSSGREAHEDVCQHIAKTYQLIQPFLVKVEVTTQQEVEQAYQQMLVEMQADDFCAVGFYLTVWGSKP